jgi:hypothetical protein
VSSEQVKASKHVVGEALPNNPLTAINKKSCLWMLESVIPTTSREAANSEERLNQIGRVRADRLAALRASDR